MYYVFKILDRDKVVRILKVRENLVELVSKAPTPTSEISENDKMFMSVIKCNPHIILKGDYLILSQPECRYSSYTYFVNLMLKTNAIKLQDVIPENKIEERFKKLFGNILFKEVEKPVKYLVIENNKLKIKSAGKSYLIVHTVKNVVPIFKGEKSAVFKISGVFGFTPNVGVEGLYLVKGFPIGEATNEYYLLISVKDNKVQSVNALGHSYYLSDLDALMSVVEPKLVPLGMSMHKNTGEVTRLFKGLKVTPLVKSYLFRMYSPISKVQGSGELILNLFGKKYKLNKLKTNLKVFNSLSEGARLLDYVTLNGVLLNSDNDFSMEVPGSLSEFFKHDELRHSFKSGLYYYVEYRGLEIPVLFIIDNGLNEYSLKHMKTWEGTTLTYHPHLLFPLLLNELYSGDFNFFKNEFILRNTRVFEHEDHSTIEVYITTPSKPNTYTMMIVMNLFRGKTEFGVKFLSKYDEEFFRMFYLTGNTYPVSVPYKNVVRLRKMVESTEH